LIERQARRANLVSTMREEVLIVSLEEKKKRIPKIRLITKSSTTLRIFFNACVCGAAELLKEKARSRSKRANSSKGSLTPFLVVLFSETT
jgi:hypothetical protein